MDSDYLPFAGDFEPADRERWLALVEKALRGADFEETLVTHTLDDIAVEPLYTRDDLADDPPGLPGQWPFTRGFRAAGTGQQGWQIRQLHGHPDPAAANSNILEDLDRGVTSLLLRIDRTFAQNEGDPDGVMAYTVDDLRMTLDRVDLDIISIMLDAGPRFIEVAGLMIELADERSYDPTLLDIAFAADPLGLIARGRADPEKSLQRAILMAKEIDADFDSASSLLANGIPYQAAGGNHVQEIATTIATGITYLREMVDAGLDASRAAQQIEFMLATDADIFETIAKFRATRRLWANVLHNCGVADVPARVAGRTPTRMLSQRDPWVNILRTTVATMGAVMGGADSVTVLPFDHVLGEPDGFSRRIARNIQLICKEESGLGRVIDPAGGSYYVEKLTHEFSERAWSMVQFVEAEGGMLLALQRGTVQDSLAQTFIRRLDAIARRREPQVGVSLFPDLDEQPRVPEEPDISALTDRARLNLEASAEFETIASPLGAVRSAELYERLREISDNRLLLEGSRPRLYLARLGDTASSSERSIFAKNVFEAGGIETVMGEATTNADQIRQDFDTSGCRALCLCGDDAAYEKYGVAAVERLRTSSPEALFLAGPVHDDLKQAGIDTFIHEGRNLLAILENLHSVLLEGAS